MAADVLERWLEEVVTAPGATALSDVASARRVLLEDALRAAPLLEGRDVEAAMWGAMRAASPYGAARPSGREAIGYPVLWSPTRRGF